MGLAQSSPTRSLRVRWESLLRELVVVRALKEMVQPGCSGKNSTIDKGMKEV